MWSVGMNSSHFKVFFETYFNYAYEKLKFSDAACVRQQIATSYECNQDDIECFFLFTKVINFKEIQRYGFYRTKNSDFYIPFFAHCAEPSITPHVELLFNYNMDNSVFDCQHIPLKKEKTAEFCALVLDNIQPLTKKMFQSSDLFTLTEPLKRTLIYFDFDFSYYTVEIENKGFNFNEVFSVRYKKDLTAYNVAIGSDLCLDFLSLQYEIGYYIDKELEKLSLQCDHITRFKKDEMLKQSFSGLTAFGCFDYTTINELDALVKEYRKVEEMYTI